MIATGKRRPLTDAQVAAIERMHRLLDEIARELRARQNFATRTAVRKEAR